MHILTLARLNVVVTTVSDVEASSVTEAPRTVVLLVGVLHHPATGVVLDLAAQTAPTAAPLCRDHQRRIDLVVQGQRCPCDEQ